jgi:hypothetical protein
VQLVQLWLRAFSLTLLIELAVALPLLGSVAGLQRRASAVVLAQLVTHPAVWFIFPLIGWSQPVYLLVAESWAVLLECALYRTVFPSLRWSKALAVAALANAASYAVGQLLHALHLV